MVQAASHGRDVEIAEFGPVERCGGFLIREEIAVDRAGVSHGGDLGRGGEVVEAGDHVWGEVEGLDGGDGGAEGAGDHAGAAGVVEEGDGVGVLGDSDEGEILLDEVCHLEGDLLLPRFDVVFGG